MSWDVHAGVAVGAGTGYGFAGTRLELSVGPIGLSAAAGLIASASGDAEWATGRWRSTPGLPVALAARFMPGVDNGPFIALSAAWFPYSYPTDDGYRTLHGDRYSLAVTGGYRFGFTRHLFGDLAFGAGIARAVDPGPTSYLDSIGPPRHGIEFQLDGALALGIRF